MNVGPGSTPSPEGFRGFVPELDIFRAFGVTAVILYHTWVYRPRFWNMLDVGWIIMDTFFVLSGFLIAGILLDTRSRPDYYWSFYTRRALRILPAYYLLISFLTLCSIFHGSGLLYPSDPALYKWGSPWWFFVYLGNIPLAITGQHPTAVRNCFVPLWSLQIEEQFYLLFPLLVRRLKLQTLAHTLLGLACFSMLLRVVLYWLFPANNLLEYVLLPCRMDGLALGAWVAVRYRQGPWNPSKRGLTLMTAAWVTATSFCAVWSGYSYLRPFNRTLGDLMSSIACAHVMVWLISYRGTRLTACLRLPQVHDLANISYGAYLFHMPILAALIAVSNRLGIGTLSGGYSRALATYILTIIVASLSWKYFESPLRRLRHRLPWKLGSSQVRQRVSPRPLSEVP